jgi:hypothetical protein
MNRLDRVDAKPAREQGQTAEETGLIGVEQLVAPNLWPRAESDVWGQPSVRQRAAGEIDRPAA